MTDHDLEQRLRNWYRADIADDERALQELRAGLAALARTAVTSRRPFVAGWRFPSISRFAPIALAATALVAAILIGLGILAQAPNVGPSPIPVPTRSSTPQPSGPLGGGLMLVHEPTRAYDPSDPSLQGPLEVSTLDVGTGQQTLLGTLRGASRGYTFEWGADRTHVLITRDGAGPIGLDDPTAAAQDLTFICCQQQPGQDLALSPRGDRIAGLHIGKVNVAGCGLCGSVPDSILILDLDSGRLRTLPLPPGSYGEMGRDPISWSPDGSAVVIGGCRPCNDPYSPGIADITPTAVEHGHLFIVPATAQRYGSSSMQRRPGCTPRHGHPTAQRSRSDVMNVRPTSTLRTASVGPTAWLR